MPFVTPACAEFLDYWKCLRGSELAPHTDAFLSKPPWRQMPSVCLAEILPNGLLLRFVGTRVVEHWENEFTGTLWEERVAPAHRGRFRHDLERVCHHPVGVHVLSSTQTSGGRTVRYEAVYLPLAVDVDKPARCLRFSQTLDELRSQERKIAFEWPDAPAWIDIGAGVPE